MPIINMVYKKKKWKYSYTFKGKTSSQIWNDWDLLTWTIQTNSNWVTWSSNTDCRIKVDIPSLANARKIVVTHTVVVNTNASVYNAAYSGVGVWTWWWSWHTIYKVFGSGYNGMSVEAAGINWNVVGNATAWETYIPTTTIDLVNKTVIGTMSWFNNSTISLTDADVTTIRNYTYLVVYVSVNRSAVSDISIKIY
jgi:hypothetical protein